MNPTKPLGAPLTGLLLAAGLAGSSLAAQPASQQQQAIATEQISGTTLAVTTRLSYESAVLRVSGPAGYALSKSFSAPDPITVDLLVDAEPPTDGVGTFKPLAPLSDGRYRYEVVLTGIDGLRRVHTGLFFAERGSAVARGAIRDDLGRLRDDLLATDADLNVASGEIVGSEAVEYDFLQILDFAADGYTSLMLTSRNVPYYGEDWVLANSFGDLRLSQNAGGFATRMTIEDGGQVGIGTTTPLQELHIDSGDGGDIRLSGSGADFLVGITGGPNDFVIWDNANSTQPFRIRPGAATLSVVVDPTGVGIGTHPSAKLHVAGSGIIEGDVALGSSRTIKHEIEPLTPVHVLNRIRNLPLYSWKYKKDPLQSGHVGPMAEDVYEVFQVGRDDKHLSPADIAGLALAAIQGVDQRLEAEIRTLLNRLTVLEARLAAREGNDCSVPAAE